VSEVAAAALERWGMARAACQFVAERENRVYRVSDPGGGDFALRIRRPGLRSKAELMSELHWLEALDRAGLCVPRPRASAAGRYLETVAGHPVDMVGWLSGRPLGRTGTALALARPVETFHALGREMARLHDASDGMDRPDTFHRAAWDIEGLLGDDPLWGRFWDSPALDAPTRSLLTAFRDAARATLRAAADGLNFGLIHADLVRENVLVDGDRLRLIDFDDGGFGFRLFDVATAVVKNRTEPDYPRLRDALIEGYRSVRPLDIEHLDLFIALRAATYVGWIRTRLAAEGASTRQARYVSEAVDLCGAWMTRQEAA
jgi:Ser/Thr protein kinase RdoA (MazF antagonist)